MPPPRPRRILLLALSLPLAACWGDATAPSTPVAVQVSASRSTLTALEETTRLTARVLDERGKTVRRATVVWSSENPTVARVSRDGVVTALGHGSVTIVASAPPAVGTVEITVDQIPTGLDVRTGVGQQGEVGIALAQPVIFQVRDQGLSPVVGRSVLLAVTRGGGTIEPEAGVTGPEGTIEVVWTLGPDASQTHELTATISGLTRTVTAIPRPGPPTVLAATPQAERVGLAGEPLRDSLAAKVLDRFGNPVPGAIVSWNADAGGGSVAPARTPAGADGWARAGWTLGESVEVNRASASAEGAPPALFEASALPNGVIQGVIAVPRRLMLPPGRVATEALGTVAAGREPALASGPGALVEEVGARAWTSPGERALALAERVDTVSGQWVVKLRDEVTGGPAAVSGLPMPEAAAQALGERIRSRIAAVPAVADGHVEVAGVSPVLGMARLNIAPDAAGEGALTALRGDPRVEWVEPMLLYHSQTLPAPAVAEAGAEAGAGAAAGADISAAGVGVGARVGAGVGPAASALVEERYFPRQSWHYGLLGLPLGWEITSGSHLVVVAVLDDGVRFDHPALAPNLTADGYDFVADLPFPRCSGGMISNAGDGGGPDPDPTIPASHYWNASRSCIAGTNTVGGHGLHVAGTIAAAAGSSGLVGVAPGVRIRPVRVLGTTGSGLSYDIAQGILYAAGLPADNGSGGVVSAPSRAHVINLSVAGPGSSASIAEAVERASAAGSLLVAAAGNGRSSRAHYPAAYTQTISVSALGPTLTRPAYSNWGSAVDVAAPGGDLSFGSRGGVWSALWNFQTGTPALGARDGTSMAAPHVSGLAALLLSRFPSLTADQLRAIILSTAVEVEAPGDPTQAALLASAYGALTGGEGLPATLWVHLVNAASGERVGSASGGIDHAFRFSGLIDGDYFVYAGLDRRGTGITGRPGMPWGALGGASAPAAVSVAGHGVRNGSFTLGWPVEQEPNDTPESANLLSVDAYVYGILHSGADVDVYRIQVAEGDFLTFETGGWYGLCGWGAEADTRLELYDDAGRLLAANDDIDANRDRRCSRIATPLEAGTYYLHVRGRGTGTYTVQVW